MWNLRYKKGESRLKLKLRSVDTQVDTEIEFF